MDWVKYLSSENFGLYNKCMEMYMQPCCQAPSVFFFFFLIQNLSYYYQKFSIYTQFNIRIVNSILLFT